MIRGKNSFSRNDRRALGGLGGAILLIVIIALVVIGASAATPFVMKQELKEGDYFIYKAWEEGGGEYFEWTTILTVMEVRENEVDVQVVESGALGASWLSTYDYTYDGNVLYVDSSYFIDRELLTEDLSSSYWVTLSGLTPLVVEKYTGTEFGAEVTLTVKMGTNLVTSLDIKYDGGGFGQQLVDTNVRWAKAL